MSDMQSYDKENSCTAAVAGEVAADRSATRKVIKAAARFAEGVHFSNEDQVRLRIVVEELLTNLLKHGQLCAESSIGYSFELSNGGALIEITDDGAPFDPRRDLEAVQRSHLDAEGGRGWPLIMSWCRVVDYRSECGRNRLHLLFPLGS